MLSPRRWPVRWLWLRPSTGCHRLMGKCAWKWWCRCGCKETGLGSDMTGQSSSGFGCLCRICPCRSSSEPLRWSTQCCLGFNAHTGRSPAGVCSPNLRSKLAHSLRARVLLCLWLPRTRIQNRSNQNLIKSYGIRKSGPWSMFISESKLWSDHLLRASAVPNTVCATGDTSSLPSKIIRSVR